MAETAPGDSDHLVSGFQMLHAPADGRHDARALVAEQQVVVVLGRVDAERLHHVAEVQRRGLDLDLDFAGPLTDIALSLAVRTKLPASVTTGVAKAIEIAAGVIHAHATDANETITVIIVADAEKMGLGFVSHGNALNLKADEPALGELNSAMDEVKHQVLPSRGFLLTLTKRTR